MNRSPDLPALTAFAAIASHRSFRRASEELGQSASTLSHLMRALEARLGVRLLNRTTRAVAPTEAGERLLARLRPALRDLAGALETLEDFQGPARGLVRVNAPELAAFHLLRTVVPCLAERYPEVEVELTVEGRIVDIVQEGFDAGVRLAEAVPGDMMRVPIEAQSRCLVVAAPAYLAGRAAPQTPADLAAHECIRLRLPGGRLYHWEFARHGQETRVDVAGRLTLNHQAAVVEAACRGLGLAYVFASAIRPLLDAGTLVPVLEDWCPAFPGMCLYYPGHRHVPAALRALIEVAREAAAPGPA